MRADRPGNRRDGHHPALAALGRAVPALTTVAPDAWRRPLALLLDGLRAHPAAPGLPTPPLTAPQLGRVLHNLGPDRRG